MPYDFEYLVINIPAYGDAGVSLQFDSYNTLVVRGNKIYNVYLLIFS